MDKETLIAKLVAVDNSRARSQQTAIGVSELGGCKRKVWHKLNGDVETNTTKRLPAILGTAIHHAIEQAFADDEALIEERVEVDGYPPATIDYYSPKHKEVVDWKTITLKSVPYFVSKQKRWQVQTYAYLLTLTGKQVDTVTLVGIPRDGTEDDIQVYSEPYDESVALSALAWLANVEALTEAPAPEMDAISFCSKYCGFYGSVCSGIPKGFAGEPITDDVVTKAALDYAKADKAIKELESAKESARLALEGVSGVTVDGITVSWSETKGRSTPDIDAIKSLLGDVPMKLGAPSTRLTVK